MPRKYHEKMSSNHHEKSPSENPFSNLHKSAPPMVDGDFINHHKTMVKARQKHWKTIIKPWFSNHD